MPDIFTPEQKIETPDLQTPTSTPSLPSSNTNPFGFLATFAHRPQGIAFANLDQSEEIILFLRRDFITNIPWISSTLILISVPLIFILLLSSLKLSLGFLPGTFLFALAGFYYIIVFGFAFYNFINWFYNIGLVTQRRILDINFSTLSSIKVAATKLTEVEDVQYAQNGFAASFFDYGNVTATTVAGKEDFVFEKVPRPAQVVDIMSKLIGEN